MFSKKSLPIMSDDVKDLSLAVSRLNLSIHSVSVIADEIAVKYGEETREKFLKMLFDNITLASSIKDFLTGTSRF